MGTISLAIFSMTCYTKYEKSYFKGGIHMAMQFPKGKFISMVKVGEKGQIVIPKGARDLFSIQPGDNLLLLADEEKGIALVPSESLDTPATLFALGREVSRDDDSKG